MYIYPKYRWKGEIVYILCDVSIRGKGVAKDTKKAAKMDIEIYERQQKKGCKRKLTLN